jgi:hypothetical protein
MKIKIAKHLPSGRMIHVDNAENGLSCDCVCEQCKETMQAVQGMKRDSHFRHHVYSQCLGAQESALHKLAKQILLENQSIALPGQLILNYENPVAEPIVGVFRADVKLISQTKSWFCEIVVSNPISMSKEFFYSQSNHNCLEIDLSEALTTNLSIKEIEELVLHSTYNKRVLKRFSLAEQKNPLEDLLKVLGLLLAFFLGYKLVKWLFSK